MYKKLAAATAAGAALAMSVPAQAAGCWGQQAYEAAQLRDFDTMLMVATLRCRINDVDFSADYNRFVREKRPILAAANEQLRGQFALAVGRARALDAYDDFVTKMANGYGGGERGMNCADYAAVARAAVDAPATRTALVALAGRSGIDPRVPGQRCGVTVALNGRP